MGLFSKKQLLKVIEWEDNTKNTVAYRYPLKDRDEIMNSSQLIVRPSQVALFVHKGQICDVFAPGTYKLATENIPILTKLLALPYGFNSPIKAEVYFVNTKQLTGLKWGTQNPIMMRDAEFGNVRIRAFGVYAFKVDNAKKFMEQMLGTNSSFTTEDVAEHIKPLVIQGFSDAVAESKISALDLAANYKEFSERIVEESQKEFDAYGLELTSLVIENISLPKEVEQALDESTKMGVMQNKMGTYMQYQAANAMRDAANNPNGNNLAGLGVGLGAAAGVGQMFSQAMASAQNVPNNNQNQEKPSNAEATKECPSCHAKITGNSKFCPECGAKLPAKRFCPNCGAEVKEGSKFCSECGAKL